MPSRPGTAMCDHASDLRGSLNQGQLRRDSNRCRRDDLPEASDGRSSALVGSRVHAPKGSLPPTTTSLHGATRALENASTRVRPTRRASKMWQTQRMYVPKWTRIRKVGLQ